MEETREKAQRLFDDIQEFISERPECKKMTFEEFEFFYSTFVEE